MITQAQVQDLFDYRDGKLFWKNPPGTKIKAGQRAGSIRPDGYRQLAIGRKKYLEHRIIFLFHHGYLPERIDHIDVDPLNNRIENLREATHSQNMCNRVVSENSKTGVKGVTWHKASGKWQGKVTKNKKQYFTPVSEDIQEVIIAVEQLRETLHGAFARLG